MKLDAADKGFAAMLAVIVAGLTILVLIGIWTALQTAFFPTVLITASSIWLIRKFYARIIKAMEKDEI